jgi:DNA-binding CsgD family transcriptional regulator/sugar-specific transcriptional regulator TrmB
VADIMNATGEPGRVYRELVCSPHSTIDALANRTGLSSAAVAATLEDLAASGSVVRLRGEADDLWEAQRPENVVAEQIRSREHELADLRSAGDELGRLFRLARQDGMSYPGLDVLRDRSLILQYYRKLQESALREIKAIDRPPYLSDGEDEASQADVQRNRMAAGVRYQTIYHDSIYADPLRFAAILTAISGGEKARVLLDPPVKLLISDDDRALVALDSSAAAPIALLVNPSGLLDALVKVFDALWRAAVPLSPSGSAVPLDDHDRAVLTLMAAGATDEVIARRLAISRRSVVRRTGLLMERLGATTRFQAGVQAARRGWL